MKTLRIVAVLAVVLTPLAAMAEGVPNACRVCICTNGETVCQDQFNEVLEGEEQEGGVCGSLCAAISSSYEGQELVETPCSELVQCGHVGVPAANSRWLAFGALALLGLGVLGLRRMRTRPLA